MGLYINGKLVGISLPQRNSGGDEITATNNTGSAITNGDKVWVETESKNFTIVGSPTIVNKVVSNFSNSNYLQVSPMANTTSGTWTFDVEFTYVTNPYPPEASNPQPIVFFADGSGNNNSAIFALDDHINANIPSGIPAGYEMLYSPNTLTSGETYHLQLELTANSSKIYIKHNGSIIDTLSGESGTYMPASITGFTLGGDGSGNYYFAGSIDLNNTNIKINNSVAWSPYSSAQPYYLINFSDVSSTTITGIAKENIAISGTGDVVIGTVVEPDLGTKTITQNGTYNASSDNLDGYSSVTVDVPSAPTKKYNLLDRVKDDSNNEIGTVSGFFTDANNVEYAVVCLDAQYRLASSQYASTSGSITNLPLYTDLVSSNVWTAKETATFNTQKILDWCSTNGYTSTACSHCRSKSFVIGNVTYYGQLPNIKEVVEIAKHYSEIESMDTSASSNTSLNFSTSRTIWSSSQCAINNGWCLYASGALTNYTKTTSRFACPVLEIPNT